MAIYLNSKRSYELYKNAYRMQYFVDKTKMLEEIIPYIGTENRYLCITRPRRFGKTLIANMIAAYLTNTLDSKPVFDHLEISKSIQYKTHLNQYQVINIDFSELPPACTSFKDYLAYIQGNLMEDFEQKYPQCNIKPELGIWNALSRIFESTGDKFVFIMDEWDSMFHNPMFSEKDQDEFLLFLKLLLKDKAYVEFAYMTGVLPITKYSSGSELNMFAEFHMATSQKYGEYFGFTESEVETLYQRYLSFHTTAEITRSDLKTWYNGYWIPSGQRIYNPRSVVMALQFNQIQNYWTNSGPYDEIFSYVKHNIADVKEDLVRMISGELVSIRIQNYAAASMSLMTKDEIFSAMVVYGFLSYKDGYVSIPNKELMLKFEDLLSNKELGYISRLALESERMLRATKESDTKTMEEILSFAHDTEIPILNYNQESDLAALVNLIYLSARNYYRVEREDRAGKGFADLIFYPKNPSDDAFIVELKVDDTPQNAILQIRQKNYQLRFCGYLGESPVYTGRILAVGMSYDKKTKKHDCVVEEL